MSDDVNKLKSLLANKVHDAWCAGELKKSSNWKMIIEACQQAAGNANDILVRGTAANGEILTLREEDRLRERIKIYRNFLPGVIQYLEISGEGAVKDLNALGISFEELF